VDLEDAADRRVKTYSGGMQRRLDLAAALVHRQPGCDMALCRGAEPRRRRYLLPHDPIPGGGRPPGRRGGDHGRRQDRGAGLARRVEGEHRHRRRDAPHRRCAGSKASRTRGPSTTP
jgi:hypothetical protein